MSAYRLALFFHLLGAFLFFAGIVVASVAFESARRRQHLTEIAAVLGIARLGVPPVAIGALLLLSFGLWLVDLAGWSLDDEWLIASLVLFIIAGVLGAVGGQRPKRARLLATRLVREGKTSSSDVARLLNNRPSLALNYAAALAVLAILVLMVWKPGAG